MVWFGTHLKRINKQHIENNIYTHILFIFKTINVKIYSLYLIQYMYKYIVNI